MVCDCVQDEITVVRNINKTLRTMNRLLRAQLQTSKEHADDIFEALCASELSIDSLGELWEFGNMQCSPEDYSAIVETCLLALEEYNERRKPMTQDVRDLPDLSGLLTKGISAS